MTQSHPMDDAIAFAAMSLGLASQAVSGWFAGHPELDRAMMLVAAPQHMRQLAVEWRTLPGTLEREGVAGLGEMWGARFGGLEEAAGYLLAEAPLLGLASRRAWGETGEVLGASELVFETRLSARGAGMALNEVAPEVPVCVHAFLAALATVDGHVGMGWRLGAAGKSHAVMSRRALFAGTETTARIAEAVGTLMREALRDFELGEAWAGFAASTIPKLRPGDEQQGMDIRVITSAGGAVEAVELDFFRIPTKLGISLVQSFNLATDKLELLGNIEGSLGVTPSVGGVTWVDRARMSYDRRGLGVEFGYVRHG